MPADGGFVFLAGQIRDDGGLELHFLAAKQGRPRSIDFIGYVVFDAFSPSAATLEGSFLQFGALDPTVVAGPWTLSMTAIK